jgi:hypothetical protein
MIYNKTSPSSMTEESQCQSLTGKTGRIERVFSVRQRFATGMGNFGYGFPYFRLGVFDEDCPDLHSQFGRMIKLFDFQNSVMPIMF